MYGGDERVNAYVDTVVRPAAAKLGVKLTRVPITDTADAVQRVIAERKAGKTSGGAVDLIWINGENFAAGKQAGLWLENWATTLPNARYLNSRDPAVALGQQVALMLEGRIIQHDEPQTLFERPASPAVARFFGAANLLRGYVIDGLLRVGDVEVPVQGADGEAAFVIRPERLLIDERSPLRAEVREAAYMGSYVRLLLHRGALVLEAHVASDEVPPVGAVVGVKLPGDCLWQPSDPTTDPTAAEAWNS
jgi:hypothetical protein